MIQIKKYLNFTSNFLDGRDFSYFMREGLDKKRLDKGVYGI